MKIVDVRTHVVGTPWRELTFVQVVTDEGLVGVGEARMVNKTDTLVACIAELADRYAIGAEPFDLELLAWRVLWEDYARAGEVTMTAVATLDIACWDLIGQALEQPVWRLMGGRFRSQIPAYANGWYQGPRDPDSCADLAREVVQRGYRALKIDPFGAGSVELSHAEEARSVDIMTAVREAVGPDISLMVEMHGRFSAATAIRVIEQLEPLRPEWVEEPVPPYNPETLRRVRQATTARIATGERVHTLADFRELIESGLVDIVQADLTHFGGLSGLRKLAGWVAAYDLLLAPHNVCGPVGTAANVHFAAATANFKILEHFNDFADPWVTEVVDEPPKVNAEGFFEVPSKPGLGVRLDPDACARHPRSHANLNLYRTGWEARGRASAAHPRN
jgi:galactonate dehydratase